MFMSGMLPAGVWQGAGNITRSAWFDGSADSLSRTGTALANADRVIMAAWVRRSKLSVQMAISGHRTGPGASIIQFLAGDTFQVYLNGTYNKTSSAVFRDSEWMHMLVSIDSTQATAGDRTKAWINGEEVTLTGTDLPLNQDIYGFGASSDQRIGSYYNGSGNFYYWNGIITQHVLLDGVSIQNGDHAVTDFLEAVTVGTNGTVYAPLSDAAMVALADAVGGNSYVLSSGIGDGTDASTNANNFTPTIGMSDAANGSTDVPSDPNSIWAVTQGGSATFSEGGAKCLPPYSATDAVQYLTIPVPATGKYYIELAPDEYAVPGLFKQGELRAYYPGYSSGESFGWMGFNGVLHQNAGTLATLNTYASGTRIMLAIDADNGNVYLGKTGTWEGSADPDAGTGAQVTGLDFLGDRWVVAIGTAANPSATATEVFSHEDDLSHTIPTGYSVLRLSNVPAPAVQGIDLFNAVTYTGDGVAIGSGGNAVTGAGFQPDFVWIKNRSSGFSHALADSSRGPNLTLFSDLTAVEGTYTEKIDSFDTDGFTHGSDVGGNENTSNIVAWCWKLTGGTETTNNDGSVTTTVQSNEFMSLIRWQSPNASGAAYTIGHGLTSPDLLILRPRNAVASWYTTADTPTFTADSGYYLILDGPNARLTDGISSTLFTTNTFSGAADTFELGTNFSVVQGDDPMLALAFKNVPGLCVIGEYTGNGLADGTFVHTGFRPRWIMIKGNVAPQEWLVYDTARNPSNDAASRYLEPDTNNTEGTDFKDVDILANGFKLRDTTATSNQSGTKYLYIAIADVATGTGLPPIPGR